MPWLRLLLLVLASLCVGAFRAEGNGTEAVLQWPSLKQPRALVHLGMNKAGSTYLQYYLENQRQFLHQHGYSLLLHGQMLISQPKHVVRLFSDFISNSERKEHSVIITHNGLWQLPKDSMEVVVRMLKNFDSKMVLIYREPLSRSLSSYNQHLKVFNDRNDFDSFFTAHTSNKGIYNPTAAMLALGEMVGKERIVIVDYYGILASGRDIAEVLLCDIAQLPMCERQAVPAPEASNGTAAVQSNASRDWIVVLLLMEIIHYGEKELLCKRNMRLFGGQSLHRIYEERLEQVSEDPPMRKVDLSRYAKSAAKVDKEFRTAFENNFIFGNKVANDAARAAVVYEEIDRAALMKSSYWSKWIQHQAGIFREILILVSCKD